MNARTDATKEGHEEDEDPGDYFLSLLGNDGTPSSGTNSSKAISRAPSFVRHRDSINETVASAMRTVEQLHEMLGGQQQQQQALRQRSNSDDGMKTEELHLHEAEELMRREMECVDRLLRPEPAADAAAAAAAATAAVAAAAAVSERRLQESGWGDVDGRSDDDDDDSSSSSSSSSSSEDEGEEEPEGRFASILRSFSVDESHGTFRTPPPIKRSASQELYLYGPSPTGVADVFDPIGVTIETPPPRTRDRSKKLEWMVAELGLTATNLSARYSEYGNGRRPVSPPKTVRTLVLSEGGEHFSSLSPKSAKSLVSDITDHDAIIGNGAGRGVSSALPAVKTEAEEENSFEAESSKTKNEEISRTACTAEGEKETFISTLAWLAFGQRHLCGTSTLAWLVFGRRQLYRTVPREIITACGTGRRDKSRPPRFIQGGLSVAAAVAITAASIMLRGSHLVTEWQFWATMVLLPPLAVRLIPHQIEETSVALGILLCVIVLERIVRVPVKLE